MSKGQHGHGHPTGGGGGGQPKDPWAAMEREIDAAVNDVQDKKKRYATLATNKGPRANTDAAALHEDLQTAIQQLEWDLEDMNAAVQAALDHPEKFTINTAELVRRQDVIQQLDRKISKVKEDVDRTESERRKRVPTKPDGKGGTVTKIGIDALVPFHEERAKFESVEFKSVDLKKYDIRGKSGR